MQAIGSVMTYGMNLILEAFGTAQTVFGIYFKLQSFIFMPVFGLNSGMVPIIAYNFGAGSKERVVRTMKSSIKYAVGIMLAGLAVMELFPAWLIGLFDAEASSDLLVIGIPALRIICLSFCFAGYCIVVGSVFQALGNAVYSMLVSIARQLCVLLPVAWLFSLSGNVNPIWWAFPIAESEPEYVFPDTHQQGYHCAYRGREVENECVSASVMQGRKAAVKCAHNKEVLTE